MINHSNMEGQPAGDASVWLDLLSKDVCMRIATMVSFGQQALPEVSLSLAETSERQMSAIQSALHHSFTLTDKPVLLPRWVSIFAHTIRHLDVSKGGEQRDIDACYQVLEPLLSNASLQSAVIIGTHKFLSAMGRGPLKVLEIHLYGDTPKDTFVTTLANTTAEELSLVCANDISHEGDWIIIGDRCFLTDLRDQLPALSVRFTTVRIDCQCHECGVWSYLHELSNLKQLAVSSNPPDDVIRFMRGIETVKLRLSKHSASCARALQYCVEQLSTHEHFGNDDIAGLVHCARLRRLKCALLEGADGGFDVSGPALSAMRDLRLSWRLPTEIVEGCAVMPCMYWEATPGAMRRAVELMPELEILHLECRIRLVELVDIMRHLGGRLREFCCAIADQREPAWMRLAAVLDGILAHNRCLRKLTFAEFDLVNVRREGKRDPGLVAPREEVGRLRCGVRVLKRIKPLLCLDDADRIVGEIDKMAASAEQSQFVRGG